MKKKIFSATLFLCVFGTLFAQQIKLNEKFKVDLRSVTENTDRTIYVQLPKDYGHVNKHYPLIILFDAQDKSLYQYTSSAIDRLIASSDIPEAIFVGIVQKDRSKELNFEGREKTSLLFLDFISNELIAYLGKTYALNGYYTLIGHSLGGQFVTNAMLTYPETFRSAISVSGALVYPKTDTTFKRKVLSKLKKYLSTAPDSLVAKQKYYFSTGNEGFQDSLFQVGALEADRLFLRYKPRSVNWHFDYLKGFNHMTTPLVSIPSGLIFIFHDWHLPESLAMDVLLYQKTDPNAALIRQRALIRKTYGTDIMLPYNAYAQFEDFYYRKGDFDKAGQLAQQLIDLYPDDEESYVLMADILEKKGNLKGAIEYLQKAQSKSSPAKYSDRISRLNSKQDHS